MKSLQTARLAALTALAMTTAPVAAMQDADPPGNDVPSAPEASAGEITGDAKAGLVEAMIGSSGSSHTESSSESSSSSVTINAAPDAGSGPPSLVPTLGKPAPWAPRPSSSSDPNAALFGSWQLGASGATARCKIMLKGERWKDGAYTASPGSDCPGWVGPAIRWNSSGRELWLLDHQRNVLATLYPTGPGSTWTGRSADGTAISISR